MTFKIEKEYSIYSKNYPLNEIKIFNEQNIENLQNIQINSIPVVYKLDKNNFEF